MSFAAGCDLLSRPAARTGKPRARVVTNVGDRVGQRRLRSQTGSQTGQASQAGLRVRTRDTGQASQAGLRVRTRDTGQASQAGLRVRTRGTGQASQAGLRVRTRDTGQASHANPQEVIATASCARARPSETKPPQPDTATRHCNHGCRNETHEPKRRVGSKTATQAQTSGLRTHNGACKTTSSNRSTRFCFADPRRSIPVACQRITPQPRSSRDPIPAPSIRGIASSVDRRRGAAATPHAPGAARKPTAVAEFRHLPRGTESSRCMIGTTRRRTIEGNKSRPNNSVTWSPIPLPPRNSAATVPSFAPIRRNGRSSGDR
jgi:hypothetical protein